MRPHVGAKGLFGPLLPYCASSTDERMLDFERKDNVGGKEVPSS